MPGLLDLLRQEAASLGEHDLPANEELRPIVGALVKRVERLELDQSGELAPAPDVPERQAEPQYQTQYTPPAPEEADEGDDDKPAKKPAAKKSGAKKS